MNEIREGVIGVKDGGVAGGAEGRSSEAEGRGGEGGVKGRGTAGGFEALTDQLHVTIRGGEGQGRIVGDEFGSKAGNGGEETITYSK